MPSKEIYYSEKYTDDKYEYRHVMLPKVSTGTVRFSIFIFFLLMVPISSVGFINIVVENLLQKIGLPETCLRILKKKKK
jgi:Cyclin-dependent kinase regulatory subunit